MISMSFPHRVSLSVEPSNEGMDCFLELWQKIMQEECHGHTIWGDPFATTLSSSTGGKFKFELAAVWSVNMVIGSYCFPRYVSALAARSEHDIVRYGLLENAWDESGSTHHQSRSHFWLAVRLAELLGLGREEIETIRPLDSARKYTDQHYEACASGDFLEALGMICLIEEFTTPEFTMIFKSFLDSCQEGLDMSAGDFILRGGGEYFTANIADDERHREEMPRLVAFHLKESGVNFLDAPTLEESLNPIRMGVRRSVELRSQFFQGIYDFVSKGGTYRHLSASSYLEMEVI